MSIASEITRIQGNISDSYTAISNKGGTLPATQNSDNLATAIGTIPSGSGPKYMNLGRSVNSNGELVRNFSPIDLTGVSTIDSYTLAYVYNGILSVNSPAFTNYTQLRRINTYALFSAFTSGATGMNNGITDTCLDYVEEIVGDYALGNAFRYSLSISDTKLHNLKIINGANALSYAFQLSGVTEIGFENVEKIIGNYCLSYTFSQCQSLNTAINMPKLVYMSGDRVTQSTFWNSRVTSISADNLIYVGGNTPWYSFYSTSNNNDTLTTVSFNSLCILDTTYLSNSSYRCFSSVVLSNVYLGGLNSLTFTSSTTPLTYFFGRVGQDCILHFPSNFDPADPNHTFDASTLGGYPLFGSLASDNLQIAYDLPASYALMCSNSKAYARYKLYDTSTSLAWLNQTDKDVDTVYYTSGTTYPAVNDTIYSDAACTTAVTTIDSIV